MTEAVLDCSNNGGVVDTVEAPAFTETIKVALYGAYGSRKTLQIGNLIKAAGSGRVLVVSAEHGLGTIRSLLDPSQVRTVHDKAELRQAFAEVKESFNTPDYWVCIDGGSQIVEWIANEQFTGADEYFSLDARKQAIPDKLKEYGRYISDRSHTIDTQRIYGRIGRDSENLWAAWIRLQCNLYVNFLEDMTGVNDKREKTIPWGPDVPGKMGLKAVMSSFDFVGRLSYDGDGKLVGHFNPKSPIYMARTREDRAAGIMLPTEIADFDLSQFIKLVRP